MYALNPRKKPTYTDSEKSPAPNRSADAGARTLLEKWVGASSVRRYIVEAMLVGGTRIVLSATEGNAREFAAELQALSLEVVSAALANRSESVTQLNLPSGLQILPDWVAALSDLEVLVLPKFEGDCLDLGTFTTLKQVNFGIGKGRTPGQGANQSTEARLEKITVHARVELRNAPKGLQRILPPSGPGPEAERPLATGAAPSRSRTNHCPSVVQELIDTDRAAKAVEPSLPCMTVLAQRCLRIERAWSAPGGLADTLVTPDGRKTVHHGQHWARELQTILSTTLRDAMQQRAWELEGALDILRVVAIGLKCGLASPDDARKAVRRVFQVLANPKAIWDWTPARLVQALLDFAAILAMGGVDMDAATAVAAIETFIGHIRQGMLEGVGPEDTRRVLQALDELSSHWRDPWAGLFPTLAPRLGAPSTTGSESLRRTRDSNACAWLSHAIRSGWIDVAEGLSALERCLDRCRKAALSCDHVEQMLRAVLDLLRHGASRLNVAHRSALVEEIGRLADKTWGVNRSGVGRTQWRSLCLTLERCWIALGKLGPGASGACDKVALALKDAADHLAGMIEHHSPGEIQLISRHAPGRVPSILTRSRANGSRFNVWEAATTRLDRIAQVLPPNPMDVRKVYADGTPALDESTGKPAVRRMVVSAYKELVGGAFGPPIVVVLRPGEDPRDVPAFLTVGEVVYSLSHFRGSMNRRRDGEAGRLIGIPVEAIDHFVGAWFTSKESRCYAQRAFLAHAGEGEAGIMALGGRFEVAVVPEGGGSFRLSGKMAVFKPHDGCGFIRSDLAQKMGIGQRSVAESPEGTLPVDVWQAYSAKGAAMREAVAELHHEFVTRMKDLPLERRSSKPDVDNLYRSITTGGQAAYTLTAVPIEEAQILLPDTPQWRRRMQDKFPLYATSGPAGASPKLHVVDRPVGFSDALNSNVVQFSLTATSMVEEKLVTNFFKGDLIVVDVKDWDKSFPDQQIVVLHSDRKLSNEFETAQAKRREHDTVETRRITLTGVLTILKQHGCAAGVPTEIQLNSFARDYDGDGFLLSCAQAKSALLALVQKKNAKVQRLGKSAKAFTPDSGAADDFVDMEKYAQLNSGLIEQVAILVRRFRLMSREVREVAIEQLIPGHILQRAFGDGGDVPWWRRAGLDFPADDLTRLTPKQKRAVVRLELQLLHRLAEEQEKTTIDFDMVDSRRRQYERVLRGGGALPNRLPFGAWLKEELATADSGAPRDEQAAPETPTSGRHPEIGEALERSFELTTHYAGITNELMRTNLRWFLGKPSDGKLLAELARTGDMRGAAHLVRSPSVQMGAAEIETAAREAEKANHPAISQMLRDHVRSVASRAAAQTRPTGADARAPATGVAERVATPADLKPSSGATKAEPHDHTPDIEPAVSQGEPIPQAGASETSTPPQSAPDANLIPRRFGDISIALGGSAAEFIRMLEAMLTDSRPWAIDGASLQRLDAVLERVVVDAPPELAKTFLDRLAQRLEMQHFEAPDRRSIDRTLGRVVLALWERIGSDPDSLLGLSAVLEALAAAARRPAIVKAGWTKALASPDARAAFVYARLRSDVVTWQGGTPALRACLVDGSPLPETWVTHLDLGLRSDPLVARASGAALPAPARDSLDPLGSAAEPSELQAALAEMRNAAIASDPQALARCLERVASQVSSWSVSSTTVADLEGFVVALAIAGGLQTHAGDAFVRQLSDWLDSHPEIRYSARESGHLLATLALHMKPPAGTLAPTEPSGLARLIQTVAARCAPTSALASSWWRDLYDDDKRDVVLARLLEPALIPPASIELLEEFANMYKEGERKRRNLAWLFDQGIDAMLAADWPALKVVTNLLPSGSCKGADAMTIMEHFGRIPIIALQRPEAQAFLAEIAARLPDILEGTQTQSLPPGTTDRGVMTFVTPAGLSENRQTTQRIVVQLSAELANQYPSRQLQTIGPEARKAFDDGLVEFKLRGPAPLLMRGVASAVASLLIHARRGLALRRHPPGENAPPTGLEEFVVQAVEAITPGVWKPGQVLRLIQTGRLDTIIHRLIVPAETMSGAEFKAYPEDQQRWLLLHMKSEQVRTQLVRANPNLMSKEPNDLKDVLEQLTAAIKARNWDNVAALELGCTNVRAGQLKLRQVTAALSDLRNYRFDAGEKGQIIRTMGMFFGHLEAFLEVAGAAEKTRFKGDIAAIRAHLAAMLTVPIDDGELDSLWSFIFHRVKDIIASDVSKDLLEKVREENLKTPEGLAQAIIDLHGQSITKTRDSYLLKGAFDPNGLYAIGRAFKALRVELKQVKVSRGEKWGILKGYGFAQPGPVGVCAPRPVTSKRKAAASKAAIGTFRVLLTGADGRKVEPVTASKALADASDQLTAADLIGICFDLATSAQAWRRATPEGIVALAKCLGDSQIELSFTELESCMICVISALSDHLEVPAEREPAKKLLAAIAKRHIATAAATTWADWSAELVAPADFADLLLCRVYFTHLRNVGGGFAFYLTANGHSGAGSVPALGAGACELLGAAMARVSRVRGARLQAIGTDDQTARFWRGHSEALIAMRTRPTRSSHDPMGLNVEESDGRPQAQLFRALTIEVVGRNQPPIAALPPSERMTFFMASIKMLKSHDKRVVTRMKEIMTVDGMVPETWDEIGYARRLYSLISGDAEALSSAWLILPAREAIRLATGMALSEQDFRATSWVRWTGQMVAARLSNGRVNPPKAPDPDMPKASATEVSEIVHALSRWLDNDETKSAFTSLAKSIQLSAHDDDLGDALARVYPNARPLLAAEVVDKKLGVILLINALANLVQPSLMPKNWWAQNPDTATFFALRSYNTWNHVEAMRMQREIDRGDIQNDVVALAPLNTPRPLEHAFDNGSVVILNPLGLNDNALAASFLRGWLAHLKATGTFFSAIGFVNQDHLERDDELLRLTRVSASRVVAHGSGGRSAAARKQ